MRAKIPGLSKTTRGEGQPRGTETETVRVFIVIYLSVTGITINSFFIAFYKKNKS